MLTSKSFQIILMNFFLTMMLVGCNLPKPQDKPGTPGGSAVATFKAKANVSKSQALETQVQGAFALPSTKVYNLVACLKDVAYDRAIQGHEFTIVETQEKTTSDKDGCITWAERVDFNYLSDSQYIVIERTIRGEKLHKGEQKVSYAINPWSHGENLPAVLNPEDGNEIPRLLKKSADIELALKGFAKDSQPITRPLLVDEGRFFITEQKMTTNNITMSVEVHPKVNLQLIKMNGDTFSRPLTSGTFRARLKLIHIYNTNKEIRRLMAETPYVQATMVNGNLSIKSPMTLPALPTRGQFFLGLELDPVGAPQGMTGFQGLYYVSEYDSLKGTGFLKLSPIVSQNPNFTLATFINASLTEVMNQGTAENPVVTDGKKGEETIKILKNPNRPNELESDVYQRPKIQILKLDFDFLRVGQEHTSTRQIFYTIKACFRHGLDQKTVRAQTFKITKFRQSMTEKPVMTDKTTDANSCVIWDENITFNYFDCHRYLKGSVKIENADLGVNENIDILLNPWENNGSALGRDVRYVDPKEALPMNCKSEARPRTQIAVDGFSYNTVSYRYKIDNFMNMTMVKKVLFKMDTRMLVYSSLSNGWSDPQRLRDGVYLLRTAIVKNRDYDDGKNTFVTSAEKLVNVIAGQINSELTFETQDLKALGNRNSILVELFPVVESKVSVVSKDEVKLKDASQPLGSAIDANTGLETPTFVGTIVLNVDDANRTLRILDGSVLSELFVRGNGVNDAATSNLIEGIVRQGQKDLATLQTQIAERAKMSTFIKENNVDPVDLKLMKTDTPLTERMGDTKLDEKYVLSKAELQDIIDTGKISGTTAAKLCAFWSKDYWRVMYGKKGGVNYGWIDGFGMSCAHDIKKNSDKVFQVDRQMFIKSIAGSEYVGGVNQGYSIGTNFSMSATHSSYRTHSWSLGGKAGLSKKFADLFSLGAEVGYSVSWGETDAKSTGDGISLNGVKSVTVQTNTYKVRVDKYEQCVVVRLNPSLFAKSTSWIPSTNYNKFINPKLDDNEKITAITRGLMLCDGGDRTTPKDVVENYYMINQETSSTGQQDNGDDRNRKFFIALRSANDFNTFMGAVRAQLKGTVVDEKVSVENKAIEALFQSRGPAYPGLYRN